MRQQVVALPALLVVMVLGACGGGTGSNGSPAPQPRPSSAAVVAIDQPSNGDKVKGPNVRLVIRLEKARVVEATTSTNLKPDEGHLVYTLDNGTPLPAQLTMTIPNVAPGEHVIRVEFVAADGKSFASRVETAVLFDVT